MDYFTPPCLNTVPTIDTENVLGYLEAGHTTQNQQPLILSHTGIKWKDRRWKSLQSTQGPEGQQGPELHGNEPQSHWESCCFYHLLYGLLSSFLRAVPKYHLKGYSYFYAASLSWKCSLLSLLHHWGSKIKVQVHPLFFSSSQSLHQAASS